LLEKGVAPKVKVVKSYLVFSTILILSWMKVITLLQQFLGHHITYLRRAILEGRAERIILLKAETLWKRCHCIVEFVFYL